MNPKKKIAFYIESMVVGGAEKVLIDLVNNLDKDKFDITVIAIFKKSVYSDYEFQFEDGCLPHIHYRYLIDNTQTWKYQLFNRAYNRLPKSWLYRFLVKETFDVEVAFYEGMPTDFVAHAPSKSKKIAWLHTHQARLYENKDTDTITYSRDLYRRFDKIIGVSEAVVQSFVNIMGSMPIQCIYNYLDIDNIVKKADEKVTMPFYGTYWITVGRLIPIKGYDRLIRVLSRLKAEGYVFNLLMLGDGKEKIKLQELVVKLDLNNQVIFAGNCENPYPFIKHADCLIMSSIQEGLSTVVMESLLIGTPVVSTDCSGMRELIEDGITGLIVDNNEESLYEIIKKILNNPSIINTFKEHLKSSKNIISMINSIKKVEKLMIK